MIIDIQVRSRTVIALNIGGGGNLATAISNAQGEVSLVCRGVHEQLERGQGRCGGGQQWSLREISARFLNNGHPIGGKRQQKQAASPIPCGMQHTPPPPVSRARRSSLISNFGALLLASLGPWTWPIANWP
jgi:hypothetical protein